jgi:hypothetical protein
MAAHATGEMPSTRTSAIAEIARDSVGFVFAEFRMAQ